MISARNIRELVKDISGHDKAASVVTGQGTRAVPALSAYLDQAPESVPHARRFAVDMLAAIRGAEATVALRRALHRHDLCGLTPVVAQSEWLVKNAAFAALAEREGSAIVKEMDYGLHEARLSAAVRTAGHLKLAERIPCLVHVLSDDILSGPSRDALSRFGARAAPALLDALSSPITDIAELKRAINALDLLARCQSRLELSVVRTLVSANQPALAASAALALARKQAPMPTDEIATVLVRGALLKETTLARRCLGALDKMPARALVNAALTVLQERTVQDLYGDSRALSRTARARVAARILRRPDVDASPLVRALPEDVLLVSMRGLTAPPSALTSAALRRHRCDQVRDAFE